MDNSINFKGAFLIKNPTPVLKDSIPPLLGKKWQKIENLNNMGDVLYVVRDKFDRGISDVLQKLDDVNFEYYPTLNTKSGFDDEKPQEAMNIIRTATDKVISTVEGLKLFFKPKPKMPYDIVKIQENNLKLIQNKLFVDLDNKNYIKHVDTQTGICTVKVPVKGQTKKHNLVSITPPGKYGICYVTLKPISADYPVRHIAVRNGEIIFEYTDPASKAFVKNSHDAKSYYTELLNKYKNDLAEYNQR